jgi:hypothetical protein
LDFHKTLGELLVLFWPKLLLLNGQRAFGRGTYGLPAGSVLEQAAHVSVSVPFMFDAVFEATEESLKIGFVPATLLHIG